MKTRFFAFALAIATTFAFAPVSNTANAAPNKAPVITYNRVTAVSGNVTGTATNALGQLINFAGTFTPTSFITKGGQLYAVGTLAGTLTNTVTGVTQAVSQLVQLPVTGASGSCTILTLDIGAIHLNLLGLVVDLSAIHLQITAQQGSGNLLGNLLCAVANLLNGGGPLTSIANLLNQILGAL